MNSLKIALGCNFYNARAELKRLLDSIPPGFIEYFIGVDGIYRFHKEKYPDMPDYSNDGSYTLLDEAIKDGKFAFVCQMRANKLEFEKRNAYLELCESLDYDIDVLLIVDTDEFFIYPEGTKPEDAFTQFKKNIKEMIRKHKDHNVFSIRGLNMNANPPYDCAYPRIFVNPGQMRYLQFSHYYYGNIYREKKEIEQFAAQRYIFVQYSAAIIKGIVLAHSHDLRSKEYMKQREEYIEYLKRFEGLVQSYYFNSDQAHRLAMLGVDRNEINIKNKDEYIKKYLKG